MTSPVQPTRRELLAGLAGAATLAAFPARAASPGFAFLAIGDWGRDGASHQRDVAARMGEHATRIGSAFVLSVGDNFYEDGVQSVRDPQWRTSFEDVYTARSLQTPWYAILGNHDYHGVPQAQIDYSAVSPRWRMPARHFVQTFTTPDGQRVELFAIDTNPFVTKYHTDKRSAMRANVATQDVAAQLQWLDGVLAASRADWKIVTGHHPVFSGGSEHGSQPELIARVKPLLDRHGVQLYVNGHDHDLQQIEVGGVTYVCTGAGSETRPTALIAGTRFCADRSGFTAYRIAGERMSVDFIDYTGAVLHRAEIARTPAALARAA